VFTEDKEYRNNFRCSGTDSLHPQGLQGETTFSRTPCERVKTDSGRKGMAMTAADVMIETPIKWGVEVIFGFPGDGINGMGTIFGTGSENECFWNKSARVIMGSIHALPTADVNLKTPWQAWLLIGYYAGKPMFERTTHIRYPRQFRAVYIPKTETYDFTFSY
jgi:hypothetical protein